MRVPGCKRQQDLIDCHAVTVESFTPVYLSLQAKRPGGAFRTPYSGLKERAMSVRVISGVAKGCKLQVPRGLAVRPTSDRAKEGLFNIIGGRVTNCHFLDLYAGSGAIGIEALSRGATSAVFVEKQHHVARIIRRNLTRTSLADRARVMVADAGDALKRLKKEGEFFDIIFADPPYKLKNTHGILQVLVNKEVLNADGLVIWEHASMASIPASIGNMLCLKEVRYGDTSFSFLS